VRSAQAEARLERDVEIARGRRPAAPVRVHVGRDLELREVRVVEVAARLEHDDLQAALGQLAGHHAATGARADDAHVGLEHGVVVRHQRSQRLVVGRRRAHRAGVAEGRPARVVALLVGQAVVEVERQRGERAHSGGRVLAHERDVAQDLLAGALG
jgi:hypothetical protein